MRVKTHLHPMFAENSLELFGDTTEAGLEINFVEYWPIGHLSQILTGQTVSFTGHM